MLNSTVHEILTAHKTVLLKNNDFSFIKSLRCYVYPAKKVKMTTDVGILTFMSRINIMFN